MCLGGGAPKDNSAQIARQREAERQANITQGTADIDKAFAGFNPDFFTGRETAFTNYAQPQLDDQYAEAKKQLAYALERKGLSASSSAADQYRKLGEQYNTFKTDVSNQSKSYSNKARSDIESARSDLLGQLTATEDPSATAAAALRRSELLSAPPAFDPLSAFVFTVGQGLANQSAQNGYQGLVKTPLFNSSNSSSSVRYNN